MRRHHLPFLALLIFLPLDSLIESGSFPISNRCMQQNPQPISSESTIASTTTPISMVTPSPTPEPTPTTTPTPTLTATPTQAYPSVEDIHGVFHEDLEGIRNTLATIEADVRPPTLWEKILDDTISNAIWAFLTRSGSQGNRIRWLASLISLFLFSAKIILFIRERRNLNGYDQGTVHTSVDFLIIITLFALACLFFIISVFGGLTDQTTSTFNPSQLVERLDRIETEIDNLPVRIAAEQVTPMVSSTLQADLDNVENSLTTLEEEVAALRETASTRVQLTINTWITILLGAGIVIIVWRECGPKWPFGQD